MKTVEETIQFIQQLYEGQTDKAGISAWLHPKAVMDNLGPDAPEHEKLAALLHDVVEDKLASLNTLDGMGYSYPVLAAVDLLTKPEGMTYFDYIRRIANSHNATSIRVKLADLKHNLSRTEELSMKVRYTKAQAILKGMTDHG